MTYEKPEGCNLDNKYIKHESLDSKHSGEML